MKDGVIFMINKIKGIFSNRQNILIFVGILVFIIVCILMVVLLFNKNGVTNIAGSSDAERIKEEYESLNGKKDDGGKVYPEVKLPTNNILKYTNIQKVLDVIEYGEDAVIYIGYSTCLYCRGAIEVLCNTASFTELDVIYYLDIDEDDDKYDELVNVLGDEFVINENNKNKLYVPLVLFVADGRIVSYKKGTLDTHEDPYTKLDKYQVEGLGEIYKYGIMDVLNSMDNKKRDW